jgi:ferredoxin-NADP reductase
MHGVRGAEDLAYRDYIERELPNHELLGDTLRDRLLYYPAVSREPFTYNGRDHQGRITDHLDQGRIATALGLEALDPARDRAMICGSPQMLADFRGILDRRASPPRPASAPRASTCSSAPSSRSEARAGVAGAYRKPWRSQNTASRSLPNTRIV